ncbi:zinc ribbon domain-containing protein [Photobacterium phosphoreum]
MLNYKADKFGGSIIAVNPAYTSKACSECGHKLAENRKSQAVFQYV